MHRGLVIVLVLLPICQVFFCFRKLKRSRSSGERSLLTWWLPCLDCRTRIRGWGELSTHLVTVSYLDRCILIYSSISFRPPLRLIGLELWGRIEARNFELICWTVSFTEKLLIRELLNLRASSYFNTILCFRRHIFNYVQVYHVKKYIGISLNTAVLPTRTYSPSRGRLREIYCLLRLRYLWRQIVKWSDLKYIKK